MVITRRRLIAAVLVIAAAYVARVAPFRGDVPNTDVHTYVIPAMVYALRALADGGRGLLWNPLQNCGQAFFGNSQSALLYPANLALLVAGMDRGWLVFLFCNVLVAGVGMYGFCRSLGTGRLPALIGALVFEAGRVTDLVIGWVSTASSPYVWIPAVLWCVERIIQAPRWRRALPLAAVLAVALLAGSPQLVVYTYQWIALRLVWEVIARRWTGTPRLVAVAALGLLGAPLLVAVQLFPAIEVAMHSVRNITLDMEQLLGPGTCYLTWKSLRQGDGFLTPFALVPSMLALAALAHPATRRASGFLALMAVLTTLLALARELPLFGWYTHLPLGTLFRCPGRFLWMTAVALAALAGLGTQALLAGGVGPPVALLAGAATVALGALGPTPVGAWMLATALVLASALAVAWPAGRRATGLLVAACVAAALYLFPVWTPWRLAPNNRRPLSEERLLVRLRQRLTPQDRVYLVAPSLQIVLGNLWPRVASLYGIPSIQDYEPQVTGRYLDYWLMLQLGRRPITFEDAFRPALPPASLNRRLFDLTGARYVVTEIGQRRGVLPASPPLLNLDREGPHQLFLNGRALPRARWVGQVEVVPDPSVLLDRLAFGSDDLEQIAFLEAPPPSGFLGGPAPVRDSTVTFVTNDPEHLVLDVNAPARGFLFLADQFFPGWQARIDGRPTPILRADFVFRLVEVPAGRSTVEFRYRPATVAIGFGVSLVTLVGMVGLFVLSSRREPP